MKTCTKCGQTKPLEAFSTRASSNDGRESQCRECASERGAAYHKANREEISARKAAYYEENRERVRARNAAYREANREEVRAQQAAYREETIRARHAEAAGRYRAEGAFPIPEELLGRRVGYVGAHTRVRRHYGPAPSQPCAAIGCDRPAEAWALVNPDSPHVHTEWREDTRHPDRPPRRIPYSTNPQDYRPLCHGCHTRLDVHGQNVIEGAAT